MEIKVGDIVTVKKESRIIESPFRVGGHGFGPPMELVIGKRGKVHHINQKIHYHVEFEDGRRYCYDKLSLTKPVIMDDGTELEVWL